MLETQFTSSIPEPIKQETSNNKPDLIVSTRPEIRKGCCWEIHLRFSQDIIKKHNLKQIYLEKPHLSGRDVYYLSLKVRSKLIVPRRELSFRKVAEIENDGEFAEINDQGILTLKVRFTQRPRAVFHKHADVMILVVILKYSKNDVTVASDEHELVFRGGTGSLHSADNRKKMLLEQEYGIGVGASNMLTVLPSGYDYLDYRVAGATVAASTAYNNPPAPTPQLLATRPHASSLPQATSLSGSAFASDVSSRDAASDAEEAPSAVLTPTGAAFPTTAPNAASSAVVSAVTTTPIATPSSSLSSSVSATTPLTMPPVPPLPDSSTSFEVLNAAELVSDFMQSNGLNVPTNGPFMTLMTPSPTHQPVSHVETISNAIDSVIDLTAPSLSSSDTLCNSFLSTTPSGTAGFATTASAAPILDTPIGFCHPTCSTPTASASNSTATMFLLNNPIRSVPPHHPLSTSSTAFLTSHMSSQMADVTAFGLDTTTTATVTRTVTPSCTHIGQSNEDSPVGHTSQGDASSALASTSLGVNTQTDVAVSSSLSSDDAAATTGTLSNATTSEIPQSYTVVYGKKRGACRYCGPDACEQYRGGGGVCNNCGCFPVAHVDVDRNLAKRIKQQQQQQQQQQSHNAKRKISEVNTSSDSELDYEETPLPSKRRKYLLEAEFYQKLFFKCLTFMTLEEIATVCRNAPIPIFVKDENSVYRYANPAFCEFILDTVCKENILNKSTVQVFQGKEGEEVVKTDKYIMSREGKIITFNLAVNRQEYRVMKRYTKLRDGLKVVVGAVVSSV
jgi:hypothetical protein